MSRGPKADYRSLESTSLLVLSDGVQRWGLPLVSGADGFIEAPIEPNTLLRLGGGERWGTFDPVFGHIEQSTWTGGRGSEDFEDDQTKFFDSMNLWTLTPRRVCQSLQWKFASGLRSCDSYMPGNMEWQELYGAQLYYSQTFTASASYNADKGYMWIRRRGSPGTLTFKLHSDSSGSPGSVLQTVTKDTDDITDVISVLQVFDWSSTQALTSASVYHISVYGASTDNKASHWEVGGTSSAAGAKYSSSGSAWTTNSNFKLYYRIVDADVNRRFIYFKLYNCLFAIDSRADATASEIYVNGDLGVVTSATSTTLVDTNAGLGTWAADKFNGCRVRIVAGPGVGQDREILDMDTTTLTVAAWDKTPTTASVYCIYDTEIWTHITAATQDVNNVATSVVVVDNIAHIANGYLSGASNCILRLRFNTASPTALEGETTTAGGDVVWAFEDPDDGMQIWTAANSTARAYRANAAAWGASLSFNTGTVVGGNEYSFLAMLDYNNTLYVRKQDGLWSIASDEAQKLSVGLDKMPEWVTYSQMLTKDLFLYIPFQHSLETLYAGNFDDMGPWKNAGMPAGRSGVVSCLESLPHIVILGINAGTGTSSVLAWDGRGFHELIRGFESGQKIEGMHIQPIPGGRNRMWASIGGDMIYVKFPKGLNPLRDVSSTGVDFQHEAVVEGSAISMGAHLLYKYFKEMVFATNGLHTAGREVYLDYQTDENVGTSNWIQAGSVRHSPRESLLINEGEVHRIRPRLRLCTNNAKTPTEVWGTVLMGFGRKPAKRQWNIKVKVDNAMRMSGGDFHGNANEFYQWLFSSATRARGLRMTAAWEGINGIPVIVQPPTVWRKALDNIRKLWSGQIQISVMEA